jgi:hypothetical protein
MMNNNNLWTGMLNIGKGCSLEMHNFFMCAMLKLVETSLGKLSETFSHFFKMSMSQIEATTSLYYTKSLSSPSLLITVFYQV